jgi:phosphatidylglycerol:prolipoprotein diacylglycerol transferase
MFTHAIDPVIVSLGPIEVRWYGVAYLAAFLLCYWWLRQARDELNLTVDAIDDLLFSTVLGVIIGGRVGYFLFYDTANLISLELFRIWNGGMAFHGGLVGALTVAHWFVTKHDLSFYDLGDLLAVPAMIGLALGRVANFINAEIVGTVTDVSWCVEFPYYEGCRHPVQLYLALKNALVAGGLALYDHADIQRGVLFWQMILWYGIGRFILDMYRIEPTYAGLMTGQWLTIAMIVPAVYALWKRY